MRLQKLILASLLTACIFVTNVSNLKAQSQVYTELQAIYEDLDWDLNEESSIAVLSVCRDGMLYFDAWQGRTEYDEWEPDLDGENTYRVIEIFLGFSKDGDVIGERILSVNNHLPYRPGEVIISEGNILDKDNNIVHGLIYHDYYGKFTTYWPSLLEAGVQIAVNSDESAIYTIEDCFLDQRNDPNWQAEPTALEFSATATQLQAGQCTSLRWRVENVQAVWVYPQGANYSNYGVVGQGNRKECPKTTTTYEMRVLLRNNKVELRQVRVEVGAAADAEPATSNTTAAPPSATRETARINNAVEVRAGPGADRIVIAKLERGETFYVQARDETGNWLLLVIPGTPDGLGWVATQSVALSTSIQNILVYSLRGQATTPASNAQTGVATPASTGVATPITGFESWGTWSRGDERWGTFAQDNKVMHGGRFAGRFDYDFPANVPNNYIVYRSVLPIKGQPQALEVWVYGDGSQHFLNAWVQDAKGQLWQFGFGRINHTGWQRMVAPLDLSRGWPNQAVGGSAATQMTYPLKFYAFVLDGYTEDKAFAGTIYVDDLAGVEGVTGYSAPLHLHTPL